MKIGIIGGGHVGTAVGKLLAAHGHEVLVSFAKSPAELTEAAAAIGSGTGIGSVADVVAFADVVVLATPYMVTAEALKQAGEQTTSKTLWDCTVALKADWSDLAAGFTTSAAEEAKAHAPWARVVKAIPPPAEVMHSPQRLLQGRKATVFVCSDDADAKAAVSALVQEIDADPVDTGPLANARYTEPAACLLLQLYRLGMGGRIALSLLRE
jgi:predicted dinucleotide-binding enzyme